MTCISKAALQSVGLVSEGKEKTKEIVVRNEEMVKMWRESEKHPEEFFLDWNKEMSRRLPLWYRQNKEVLQHVNLFSYARLMDRIRALDTVLVIEMNLADPKSFKATYWNQLSHMEEMDRNRKLTHQEILEPVRDLLQNLFLGMRRGKHVEQRYRLLFISFHDHPHVAKELPVLPMEWISGYEALLYKVLESFPETTVRTKMETGWASLVCVYQMQFSMECVFSQKVPCARHPDLPHHDNEPVVPKERLVKLAHHCGLPEASLHTSREEMCTALEKMQPTAVALELVKRYFRPMLMEGLKPSPRYMMVLKGGFNLKILLQELFDEKSMIFTSDLDFSVSTTPGGWSMDRIIRLWDKEIRAFVDMNEYTRSHFYYKPTLDLPPSSTVYAIVQLKFQGKDFLDISFNKEIIAPDRIDKRIAKKVGLPVTRFTLSLFGLIKLIIMETVPGIDERAYKLRNPFVGERPEKGIRDLYRARIACDAVYHHPHLSLSHKDILHKICSLRRRLHVDYIQHHPRFLETLRNMYADIPI